MVLRLISSAWHGQVEKQVSGATNRWSVVREAAAAGTARSCRQSPVHSAGAAGIHAGKRLGSTAGLLLAGMTASVI